MERKYCSERASACALPTAPRPTAERVLPFGRRRSRRCTRCKRAGECEWLHLRSTAVQTPESRGGAKSEHDSGAPDGPWLLRPKCPTPQVSGARSFSLRCGRCVHTRVFQAANDEWLEENQCHLLRQPALIQLEFRTDDNH